MRGAARSTTPRTTRACVCKTITRIHAFARGKHAFARGEHVVPRTRHRDRASKGVEEGRRLVGARDAIRAYD